MVDDSPFRQGIALHQAGLLDQAEAVYQAVLYENPGHADAQHYLGVIAFQRGDYSSAVARITQAIELGAPAPSGVPAEYHVNLGNALKRLGLSDQALGAYRAALERRPDLAAAWFNLGLLQRSTGDLANAIGSLNSACRAEPSLSVAWVELGECLAETGNDRQALECFERILPAARRGGESAETLRLGVRLGRDLVGLGRYEQAAKLLEPMCGFRGDDPELLNTLACAQMGCGRLGEAEKLLTQAHVLNPADGAVMDNLACLHKDAARAEEALRIYRDLLLPSTSDPGVWSNYLLTLLYSDRESPAEVLAEHRRAAAALMPDGMSAPLRQPIVPVVDRPLRLGYLSGDLRNHPVAYFLFGILRYHNRERVDAHVYDNGVICDAWTERLKACGPTWRSVRALSDRQLAELIRSDEIDVLIDLSGHTADNRLAALAGHPARVQAHYLGYPFSTGVPWIDWRLVDATTDPPGTDGFSSERLFRLPNSYYAYSAPEDAPETGKLPALRCGHLTFGVSSNLAKVSPTALDIWAAILNRFPSARLIWRARAFADPVVRKGMARALSVRGVESRRLALEGWAVAHGSRWDAFRKIDVALDTYPYNQATNTCEALWMGVPTISVRGPGHQSRMGASILNAAGLGEWVFDVDSYQAAIGQRLGELCDTGALSLLRRTMRVKLNQSALMDCRRAAAEIETACAQMVAQAGRA